MCMTVVSDHGRAHMFIPFLLKNAKSSDNSIDDRLGACCTPGHIDIDRYEFVNATGNIISFPEHSS